MATPENAASDSRREVIARALAEHRDVSEPGDGRCACGWRAEPGQLIAIAYAAHRVDAVLVALGEELADELPKRTVVPTAWAKKPDEWWAHVEACPHCSQYFVKRSAS